MLKMMRKSGWVRDSIIVIVVVALGAYVLVGFGSAPALAPDSKVANVGDVAVRVRDVSMAKDLYRNFYNEQTGWQLASTRTMNTALLLDAAKRLGVVVSDDELRDVVITNRTMPEGGFLSDEEWSQAVRRAYRLPVATYEEYLREHQLTSQKVTDLFINAPYVSEKAVEEEFVKNNRKVKLDLLVLSTFDVREQTKLDTDAKLKAFFDDNQDRFVSDTRRQIQYVDFTVASYNNQVEVTDAEIEAYYNQNLERYRREEQVRARHILVNLDGRTEEEALTKIQEVQKELEGGLDFAEAAKTHSDDGSADRGGDLGFFGRGDMVAPFENTAFAMEVGETSQPVKTQFGFHLIKKEAYQEGGLQSLDAVKDGVRATVTRDKARTFVMDLASAFRAKITDGSAFNEAAEELGYEIKISKPFDEDNRSSLGEDLGTNFTIRRAIFALENLNDVTDPINAGPRIIVAQWVDELEPAPLDYNDDRQRIQAEADQISAETFIENFLYEVRGMAEGSPEQSLQDIAGDRDFLKENLFRTTDWVTEDTIPWELRREGMNFEEEIYNLNPKDFVEGIESGADNRYVLARIADKEVPDLNKLNEERIQIVERLRSQQSTDLLMDYLFKRRQELDPSGEKAAKIDAAFGSRR